MKLRPDMLTKLVEAHVAVNGKTCDKQRLKYDLAKPI